MPSYFDATETDRRQGLEVGTTKAKYDKLRQERQKQQKKDREEWLLDKKDLISWMYIYGASRNDGEFIKDDVLIEQSGLDMKSTGEKFNPLDIQTKQIGQMGESDIQILREYFKDHIPDEEKEQLKQQYDKIMKAPKGKSWMVDAIKSELSSHPVSHAFEVRSNIVRAEQEYEEARQKQIEERCDGCFGFMKCAVEDAGKLFGADISDEGISDTTNFIRDIPIIGDIVEGASDAYQEFKEGLDKLGAEIKEEVPWLYEIGDRVHEQTIRKALGPAGEVLEFVAPEVTEMIEDQTLVETGELVATTVTGGAAGVALEGGLALHEQIQEEKAKEKLLADKLKEDEERERFENEPETDEEEKEAPEGYHYMPDGTLMKDEDHKSPEPAKPTEKPAQSTTKPPQSTVKPPEEPKLKPRDPRPCRPKRKPISCS